MAERRPEGILDDIEDSAVDDAIERVLAMTPQQRREHLLAQGVKLDAVHARADALQANAQKPAASGRDPRPPGPPRKLPARLTASPPSSFAFWGVVAAAAAVGALLFLARRPRPELPGPRPAPSAAPSNAPTWPPTAPPTTPAPTDIAADSLARARALRQQAFAACAAKRWKECLDGFDAAAALDPDADRAPDVQSARKDALQQLEAKEERKR